VDLGKLEPLPVHLDRVLLGISLRAQLVHADAVHGDAAFRDHLFGRATRGDARRRDELLKTFLHSFSFGASPSASGRVVSSAGALSLSTLSMVSAAFPATPSLSSSLKGGCCEGSGVVASPP